MADALKKPDDLYARDFYAWTQDQAAKLRARAAFDNRGDIDWENAAEEIESVGRSDRREIGNRMAVLLLHLLKWQFQADKRKSGWRSTIIEQRRQLRELLDESPSLRALPAEILARDYPDARDKAAAETRLPEDFFPETCPYRVEEILDRTFYPGPPAVG